MRTHSLLSGLRIAGIIALLFPFIFTQQLAAQDNASPAYISIGCYKSKNQDFDALAKEIWSPFMTHLQKTGKIMDWMMYRVVSPNGEDCDCDYREVIVHPDIASLNMFLLDEGMMEAAAAAFPGADLVAMGKRAEAAMAFQGSQTFVMVDGLTEGKPDNMDLLVVNYMTVPETNFMDYVEMEIKMFKPFHMARKEAGILISWSLMNRILPFGSEFGGNYMTIDNYGSLDKMLTPVPPDTWQKIHPGGNAMVAYQEVAKLRDLTRSEVWKLTYSLE
jgi:hypothetical protein